MAPTTGVDFALHCSSTWLRSHKISVRAPLDLRGVKKGTLRDPPETWTTGPDRLNADVSTLESWIRQSVGDDISTAVGQRSLDAGEALSRILISADDSLHERMLGMPWEILEHPTLEHPSGSLGVVRLLAPDAKPAAPAPVGSPLRFLVLWANPHGDIEEMSAHIETLHAFAAARRDTLDARLIEFVSADAVRRGCVGFSPHVVYHIGHGIQPQGRQTRLLIGAAGTPAEIDMPTFAGTIEQLGSPALVIVNACDSFAGTELNPYLGAALQCVPRFHAAIGMQAKVPVVAATHFATRLLEALAGGVGLAQSIKGARAAMVARDRGLPILTRFIPVLIQHTTQDQPFTIDIEAQSLRRLRARLASRLESIEHLPRDVDDEIEQALDGANAAVALTILTGPPDTGKSTSARAAVGKLLTLERLRRGERYFYFSAADTIFADDAARQISQLLKAFAESAGGLASGLADALNDVDARRVDPVEAVDALAVWCSEQADIGRRTAIVLDDLPPALATHLASRASRVFDTGRLLLVSRAHDLPPDSTVRRLTIDRMTPAEVRKAWPEATADAVEAVLDDTNGLPYLVAAARAGRAVSAGWLERVIDELPPASLETLQLLAAADVPVPRDVFDRLSLSDDLIDSLGERGLVQRTSDEGAMVPRMLRPAVLKTLSVENELPLRQDLFTTFESLARHERTGGFRRTRVLQFYEEALRQTLRMAEIAIAPSDRLLLLDAARAIAEELHFQYVEEGHEAEAAEAIWLRYMRAAESVGRSEEREVDVRYAVCLIALGRLGEAEDILRITTASGIEDELQIQALVLYAALLKDLGRDDSRTRRLAVLERARTLTDTLRGSGRLTSRRAADHTATIEQSIGNALGYGADADPDRAMQHAARAAAIYDELLDVRAFRAHAETVEIARYNGRLTDDARAAGIARLRRQVDELLARSMDRIAVEHLYELGRLETSPARQAPWFRLAFERAGVRVAPENWHAAIRWRIAEVRAGLTAFAQIATEIERYAEALVPWRERAWSRRVRRNALHFLAEGYAGLGDRQQQARALAACWDVIHDIAARGEGRGDLEVRQAVASAIGALDAVTGTSTIGKTADELLHDTASVDPMLDVKGGS